MLRHINEKSFESNISFCNVCIDIKQAFDKVDRQEIFKQLATLSIPKKLVKLGRSQGSGANSRES